MACSACLLRAPRTNHLPRAGTTRPHQSSITKMHRGLPQDSVVGAFPQLKFHFLNGLHLALGWHKTGQEWFCIPLSTCYPTFAVRFVDDSRSGWGEVMSKRSFNLHFPEGKEYWTLLKIVFCFSFLLCVSFLFFSFFFDNYSVYLLIYWLEVYLLSI